MAGQFECAAFSLYVYRDKDQPPLPDGWSVLLDCPSELQHEEYYGIAFIKPTTYAGETFYDVVIAHRGTIFTKIGDDWSDFLIALEKTPAQFSKGAYLFDEYVRQYMQQTYPDPIPSPDINYLITHAGHSLGAILAELCVAASVRFTTSSETSFGYTFESPGSKPIIVDLESKSVLPAGALSYAQNNVFTLLSDVDAINTCNEQIAAAYYPGDVNFIGYDYSIDSKDSGILPPGIVFYFLKYTVGDQHKMAKIYEYLKESEEYEFVKKVPKQSNAWSVGLENGYNCYLSYSLRQDYWDGYILYIWNTHPGIHADYNNDFSKWSQFFQSQLLSSSNQPKAINFLFFKPTDMIPAEDKAKKEAYTSIGSKWCVIS